MLFVSSENEKSINDNEETDETIPVEQIESPITMDASKINSSSRFCG